MSTLEAVQLSSVRKAHGLVFAGAFCISFSALFVQGAAMAPSMVAFYRLLFGGTALLLLTLAQKDRLTPSPAMLGMLLPAGAFFCGDLVTWHASIVRLGPGLATIIANFQVFFLALFGTLFLGERLSIRHKLAMPLAITGLCMLLEISPAKLPPDMTTGITLGLVSALFYTGYILSLRKSLMLAEHLSPVATMALVSCISAVLIAILCFAQGISFVIPDLQTAICLAALGILCQTTGWVLLALGLPHLPPSRAGLIMLTQPALAFLWDILFCGRATGTMGYFGAVTAILAI